MLKESYLSNIKNLPENAEKIIVTRTAGHVLSPSKALLWDYKKGRINWDQYTERFRHEMNNDVCIAAMRKIKWLSKIRDIYLICYEKKYPCHRFLLIEMINKLDEEDKKVNVINKLDEKDEKKEV